MIWYSKRQNTVETSFVCPEFLALMIATGSVEALRYNLRCFGVRLDVPAIISCDKKSVITNASVKTSILNKRHNAICYDQVRESQSAGKILVRWIPGEINPADLLTRNTISGNDRHSIVENFFHNKEVKRKDDYNYNGKVG